MIIIYYANVESQLAPGSIRLLLNKLPPGFHKDVLKFRRWQDQQSALFGKLLLIEGMHSLGYGLFQLEDLKYNEFNKPFAKGYPDFNISHSGTYTLCALNTEIGEVGVDIEEIKPIPVEEFEEQFSKKELNAMLGSKDVFRMFYTLWTQKESFLKAIGKGLNVPLNEVFIENYTIKWENLSWYLRELNVDNRYCAQLCSKHDNAEVIIKRIDFLI